MGRKSGFNKGWLIVVAVIAASFVLLEKVLPFWFLVVMAVLGISALLLARLKSYEDKREEERFSAMTKSSKHVAATVTTSNEDVADEPQSAWHDHCDRIEQAWERGDFDWARQQLQQIAYSMTDKSVTQEQKYQFTQLMKDFASQDPMYKEVMAIALPYIMANPGTIQSKIYTQLPNWSQEEVRYVLYFANELGHIHRIKKGNSYKLMPPGETVEGEVIDKSNQ